MFDILQVDSIQHILHYILCQPEPGATWSKVRCRIWYEKGHIKPTGNHIFSHLLCRYGMGLGSDVGNETFSSFNFHRILQWASRKIKTAKMYPFAFGVNPQKFERENFPLYSSFIGYDMDHVIWILVV